jgi:hypothetical protein
MSPNEKVGGEDSSERLSGRREDVEHLIAEIQQSPSPKRTGAVVLEHVDGYDDEFFECLAELITSEEARRRLDRVRTLEALRDYLRFVRRRAMEGQTADMWGELALGAVQEQILRRARDRPRGWTDISG